MITAKTNDGFEIELDENFLDDAEMIEAMTRLGKDPSAFFCPARPDADAGEQGAPVRPPAQ